MTAEEIRLYASHHQFYVQDSQPAGDTGADTFWTEDAYHRRLAIAEGILGIGTGSYDFVKVRVEHHLNEPDLNLDDWDHVTECGLDVRTGRVLINGCLSPSGLYFDVKPGFYRVRVCHANLAQSEMEATENWTGPEDWYLVQFWLAVASDVKVLKQR